MSTVVEEMYFASFCFDYYRLTYIHFLNKLQLTGRTESTNEERSTDWANAESNILNRKIA